MPATFNHIIIPTTDRVSSAQFYRDLIRDLIEAQEAPSWGPFENVTLFDGVMLQFAEPPVDIQMLHFAFLVDDALFDRAHSRLLDWGLPFWADPQMSRPDGTSTEHGGRGVYFKDPAGHLLEFITRPYI